MDIKASPVKSALHAILALCAACACASPFAVAFINHRPVGSISAVKFLLATICACGMLIWAMKNMLRDGPTVVVSDEGIQDIRESREMIPWAAVMDVEFVGPILTGYVRLKLEPNFEHRYATSIRHRLNRIFGFPSLIIHTGLAISSVDLFNVINIYRGTFITRAATAKDSS